DLKPGSNTITTELPMTPPKSTLWLRLRYQITTIPASDARTAKGSVSASQICPDLFQLTLVKPGISALGSPLHVQVRAEHPVTRRPIEGVSLRAELSFDELPSVSSVSRSTNSDGYAVFDLALPQATRDGEIKITGTRNGLYEELEGEVRIDRRTRISIGTDKNIYQPGQTIHVRALTTDPSRRAVNGAELTLKILDPEDTVVHRASLKTSRFGIASDDWAVPPNTPLGDYQIKIDRDEEDDEDVYIPDYKVRISRYELPNFAVRVTPDRGFYLPGQNAEIEV